MIMENLEDIFAYMSKLSDINELKEELLKGQQKELNMKEKLLKYYATEIELLWEEHKYQTEEIEDQAEYLQQLKKEYHSKVVGDIEKASKEWEELARKEAKKEEAKARAEAQAKEEKDYRERKIQDIRQRWREQGDRLIKKERQFRKLSKLYKKP